MPSPKRIRITGPESSGKTTLTKALAKHFGCPWVPEFAREYLANLNRPYVKEDLHDILTGQLALEDDYARQFPLAKYLFCDTGPEVIHVWSDFKYGTVSSVIAKAVDQPYDLTLLCYHDLPWTYDELREAPTETDRMVLFEKYYALLQRIGAPFQVVTGQGATRLSLALKFIHSLVEEE